MKNNPTRFLGAFAVALVITLLGAVAIDRLVGVGRDDAGGAASSEQPAPVAGGATIKIVDFAFEPATLTVKVGDTITVINEDAAKHTVTSGNRDDLEGTFDVQIEGNASETFTVDTAGTYPYICTIHPGMKGSLEVTT